MKTKKEEFKIKKSSIEVPDFIGAYMMDDSICDDLIDYFNKNERVIIPGMSLGLNQQKVIMKEL